MDGPLDDLLSRCTAHVIVGNRHRTGFFVAPGLLLTCADIVQEGHVGTSDVRVRYGETDYPASIRGYHKGPYPNLALLAVGVENHPYVYTDAAIQRRDQLFAFGYRAADSDGDSVVAEYEARCRSTMSTPPSS